MSPDDLKRFKDFAQENGAPAFLAVAHQLTAPARGGEIEDGVSPFDRGSVEAHLKREAAAAEVDEAPLTPLMTLSPDTPDPRKTVLGTRFLCVGGSMLFIGPSGIGKSSASVQQDLLWGLGREAFGIRPQRPLRILTIQAENDAEDLAEMRDGVCKGLGLSAEERQRLEGQVFYDTECGRLGGEFLAFVDRRLRAGQFDLLRIDPFQAYLGADPSDPEATAAFLRAGLNPILVKHNVACVLNHHTPKVTNRDTSNWRSSDWMYAGAGAADITNWARAAIVIDPTHAPHVFKFIAAKRGGRVGWVDDSGEKEFARYYCHASDGLYWRPAQNEDVDAVEASVPSKKSRGSAGAVKTAADLKALVPIEGSIAKTELQSAAGARGIAKNKFPGLLDELIERGELHLSFLPRRGTNPQVRVSRHEKTLLEPTE